MQDEEGSTEAEFTPHERLLQVVLGGTGVEGSSLSSSRRGSGVEDLGGDAMAESESPAADAEFVDMGFGFGPLSSILTCLGGGAGVSSTVECFPVVHGGISRNSSKVKTLGLQHL